jgi:5-methylcytosine-specific restriction enzyme subunit McrC
MSPMKLDSRTDHLELKEWSTAAPHTDSRLRGLWLDDAARGLAARLANRVDIVELRDGLRVTTTSFVGRFNLGPLQVSIRPKLDNLMLGQLLSYVCGLGDFKLLRESRTTLSELGFIDVIIAAFAEEATALIRVGLVRSYEQQHAWLGAPRGRIDVSALARVGGIRRLELPCVFQSHSTDSQINRILASGVHRALQMAADSGLRQRLAQLQRALQDFPLIPLSEALIDRAEEAFDRQTEAYATAFSLIRLILGAAGVSPTEGAIPGHAPGYLFNMNTFFQNLIGKVLAETTLFDLKNEHSIAELLRFAPHGNPRRRRRPLPRPDYALYRNGRLGIFADAKYKDLWAHALPSNWLYQLSIYALAAPDRVAILFYPSADEEHPDQILEVSGQGLQAPARIIVRTVPLHRLALAICDQDADHLEQFAVRLLRTN